jgi:hypothetical protein
MASETAYHLFLVRREMPNAMGNNMVVMGQKRAKGMGDKTQGYKDRTHSWSGVVIVTQTPFSGGDDLRALLVFISHGHSTVALEE